MTQVALLTSDHFLLQAGKQAEQNVKDVINDDPEVVQPLADG